MKKKLGLFFLIAVTATSTLMASKPEVDISEKELTLMLPVDVTNPKKKICNLFVHVPKGYKPLQDLGSFSNVSDFSMIEFIPKKESLRNFSEIVTVNKYIGRGFSADKFGMSVIEGLLKSHKCTVLQKEITNRKYPILQCIIKYEIDGEEEIVGFKYVSGPYDCAGAQYMIRLKKKDDQKAAIEKINNFISQQVMLLEVNPKNRDTTLCESHAEMVIPYDMLNSESELSK